MRAGLHKIGTRQLLRTGVEDSSRGYRLSTSEAVARERYGKTSSGTPNGGGNRTFAATTVATESADGIVPEQCESKSSFFEYSTDDVSNVRHHQ